MKKTPAPTTRPRSNTHDGYRVRPTRTSTFRSIVGTIVDAEFTTYPDTGWCVEVRMTIGLIANPYTFVLSLEQAREADIIETA